MFLCIVAGARDKIIVTALERNIVEVSARRICQGVAFNENLACSCCRSVSHVFVIEYGCVVAATILPAYSRDTV